MTTVEVVVVTVGVTGSLRTQTYSTQHINLLRYPSTRFYFPREDKLNKSTHFFGLYRHRIQYRQTKPISSRLVPTQRTTLTHSRVEQETPISSKTRPTPRKPPYPTKYKRKKDLEGSRSVLPHFRSGGPSRLGTGIGVLGEGTIK